MTTYADKIQEAVEQAVVDQHTAAYITAPLLNELARIVAGTVKATGAEIEDILDIIRNELDEATLAYARALGVD